MPRRRALLFVAFSSACAPTIETVVVDRAPPEGEPCAPQRGVALQILGSGGPVPDDARASAGYLVWVDGQARVLVDAGGGTFDRFGQSGAELGTLDAIALSHFHTDHSAELPTFVKGMFFMPRREEPIVLSGPAGEGFFPGLEEFAEGMFGERGLYRYLGWSLQRGRDSADLELAEVPLDAEVHRVLDVEGVRVDAVSVKHGPVPALAYRVEAAGQTLVFSGDQNGDNPQFVKFADDADVLVMHHAIPEKADPVASFLHIRPSEIADVAVQSKARRLVLSHHMDRSLRQLDDAKSSIAQQYEGPVIVGEDLMCIVLGG